MTSEAPIAHITVEIGANGVVFFMKGTPQCSQSGFWATMVAILAQIGIPFEGVKVLSVEEIRMGVKAFWDWPTIPQLYVKDEFIGGCDVVREMYRNDDFQELPKDKGTLPHDQKYHGLRARRHLGRLVPSAASRRFRLIDVEFKTALANGPEIDQQKLRKFIRAERFVHGSRTHPNRGSPLCQGDLTGRDPKAPPSRQAASPDKYVKFKNDLGLAEIGIGVKEFKCIGVSPPDDHPHIYHNMGDADFVNCLYCNTRYVYRPYLGRYETEPPGNLFEEL